MVVGVDVVAGGADEGAAAGHVQFGNRGEQRVEVDVRHAGVEQAAEALDEAEHLDAALVGPGDGAVNGGVQGRGIAAGGQDADAFHGGSPPWGSSGAAAAPPDPLDHSLAAIYCIEHFTCRPPPDPHLRIAPAALRRDVPEILANRREAAGRERWTEKARNAAAGVGRHGFAQSMLRKASDRARRSGVRDGPADAGRIGNGGN